MEDLDWIRVEGLAATGFHGVYPQERRDGQQFVVDLSLGVPAFTGADQLSQTVDYSVLSREVVEMITGEPVDLIETLAVRIAEHCLTHRLVQVATVNVHKPQAPMGFTFTDVSVSTTRRKQ